MWEKTDTDVSETIISVLEKPERIVKTYRVEMVDGYVTEIQASDYDTATAKAVYQASLIAGDVTTTLREYQEAITVQSVILVEV